MLHFLLSLVTAQLPASMPADQDQALLYLLASLGGLKGAQSLAVVFFAVQALMWGFRGPLGNLAGRWKMAIMSGLTVAAGVVSMHQSGVPWITAVLHSSTLAAFQVFGHQVYKQTTNKDDDGAGLLDLIRWGIAKLRPAPALALVPAPVTPPVGAPAAPTPPVVAAEGSPSIPPEGG